MHASKNQQNDSWLQVIRFRNSCLIKPEIHGQFKVNIKHKDFREDPN